MVVVVLRTCLCRNGQTHWNTGNGRLGGRFAHALFESRNLPVNYERVQIGIAAYLSLGRDPATLKYVRFIDIPQYHSHIGPAGITVTAGTRMLMTFVFLLSAPEVLFIFFSRSSDTCPRPTTACQVQWIRRCFGDRRRSVFFFSQFYKCFENIISALLG